jgi:hypothetical protein
MWLIDGTAFASGALINSVPDANWTIAGVGDYNGNFYSNILFRNNMLGHRLHLDDEKVQTPDSTRGNRVPERLPARRVCRRVEHHQ